MRLQIDFIQNDTCHINYSNALHFKRSHSYKIIIIRTFLVLLFFFVQWINVCIDGMNARHMRNEWEINFKPSVCFWSLPQANRVGKKSLLFYLWFSVDNANCFLTFFGEFFVFEQHLNCIIIDVVSLHFLKWMWLKKMWWVFFCYFGDGKVKMVTRDYDNFFCKWFVSINCFFYLINDLFLDQMFEKACSHHWLLIFLKLIRISDCFVV